MQFVKVTLDWLLDSRIEGKGHYVDFSLFLSDGITRSGSCHPVRVQVITGDTFVVENFELSMPPVDAERPMVGMIVTLGRTEPDGTLYTIASGTVLLCAGALRTDAQSIAFENTRRTESHLDNGGWFQSFVDTFHRVRDVGTAKVADVILSVPDAANLRSNLFWHQQACLKVCKLSFELSVADPDALERALSTMTSTELIASLEADISVMKRYQQGLVDRYVDIAHAEMARTKPSDKLCYQNLNIMLDNASAQDTVSVDTDASIDRYPAEMLEKLCAVGRAYRGDSTIHSVVEGLVDYTANFAYKTDKTIDKDGNDRPSDVLTDAGHNTVLSTKLGYKAPMQGMDCEDLALAAHSAFCAIRRARASSQYPHLSAACSLAKDYVSCLVTCTCVGASADKPGGAVGTHCVCVLLPVAVLSQWRGGTKAEGAHACLLVEGTGRIVQGRTAASATPTDLAVARLLEKSVVGSERQLLNIDYTAGAFYCDVVQIIVDNTLFYFDKRPTFDELLHRPTGLNPKAQSEECAPGVHRALHRNGFHRTNFCAFVPTGVPLDLPPLNDRATTRLNGAVSSVAFLLKPPDDSSIFYSNIAVCLPGLGYFS
jgi:hypothetical protein